MAPRTGPTAAAISGFLEGKATTPMALSAISMTFGSSNPSTSEWAWMSGSDTVGGHGGQPGVYGTLGTPAPQNTPGSRNFAATWTDSNGNLCSLEDKATTSNSIAGPLNDLWKFKSLDQRMGVDERKQHGRPQ